jgi:hypothetical protein
MKKTYWSYLVAVFCLMLISCYADAQMKEKGVIFAKQLFKALQNEDKDEFLQLLPDYDTYKRIMVPFDSANKITKRSDEIRIMTRDEYENGINKEMVNYFYDYLSEAVKKGFIWKKTVLDSLSINVTTTGISPTDLISLNGEFEIRFDKKIYIIKFEDAMWSKQDASWFGIGLIEQPVLKKN